MSLLRSAVVPAAVAALASVSVPTSCFGFADFAGGGVTLNTEGRLTYDSYFIGAKTLGDDEYYASLQPQLKYVRKAGLAQIDGYAGIDIIRYRTYKEFNSEDFSAGLHTELPVDEGSRISGSANLTYAESKAVDYTVFDRIPTKTLAASFAANYKLGLKMGLSDVLDYANTSRRRYSDQSTFSNNFTFSYNDFLEGTTLGLSHGYIRTTSSGDNILNADLDQTSNAFSASVSHPIVGQLIAEGSYGYRVLHRSASESFVHQTGQKGSFYTLGLKGPFLPPSRFPKLQSSASITYSEAKSPGINDLGQKTVTGDMSISWAARERTQIAFKAARSVDLSATDLSVVNSQINLSVDEKVGYATHVQAQVGYSWRDYRGVNRNDKTLDASLSAQHTLTHDWSTGASYTYQKNTTNAENSSALLAYRMRAFNYDRHMISIFVTNIF